MLISHIGELIKKSPYKREYIQDYMGVSRNTLSSWSSGKHTPKMEDAHKLADLLGVSVEDLYTYKKDGD
ncbi:helix-turn-helix transcriptional regulator [Oceanobacillus kimchii]|uniref:helix-turn-helix transcriptional regulator n=1 Tax=Oceanobacillus kimchii TaxID=746691 RepID=UPI00232F895C|nr:helix-turn-helix transcriptional regulator [Oceanobacillus kimchii]